MVRIRYAWVVVFLILSVFVTTGYAQVQFERGRIIDSVFTEDGKESFAFAKTRYPVLDEFDRSYISGHMGIIKPDPAIYAAVEEDSGLSPGALLFADDREDAASLRLLVSGQDRFGDPVTACVEDVSRLHGGEEKADEYRRRRGRALLPRHEIGGG